MREIKFRGLIIGSKEWIYGDLIHKALAASGLITPVGIAPDGCYPVAVEPESVGQYTGLKDKNGKEIYEGDVLRVIPGPMLDVWEEYITEVMSKGAIEVIGFEFDWTLIEWCDHISSENLELIGDIHTTPELLEDTE